MSDQATINKLATAIHQAGRPVAVSTIHALFPDAVFDESGLPLSKLACDCLESMIKSGMAQVTSGETLDYVAVDGSLIDFLTGISGEKLAEETSAQAMAECTIELENRIQKLADSQPPAPAEDPVPLEKAVGHPVAVKKYDQAKELETWKAWKDTGDSTHLSSLLSSYTPLIKKNASAFYGAPLPRSVIDAEAKRVAITAFTNYDPAKGVKLNTYVMSYMPKLRRYVNDHQNVARVPEEWSLRIGNFNRGESDLTSKLGRTPTSHELSDHLAWAPGDVDKMRKMLRPDLIAEQQDESLGRMNTTGEAKINMFIGYLHHELHDDEKLVFEHLYGLNGAKTANTSDELAKVTGLSVPRVNKIKTNLAEKVQSHMGQVL